MAKKNVKEVITKEEIKYNIQPVFIPEALKNVINVKKRINQTCLYFSMVEMISNNEDSELFKLMYENWPDVFVNAFRCLSKARQAYVLDKCNWKLEVKLVEK